MTLIGLFALEDPLRDKVKLSVQYARRGKINVRMVSGDNLETAVAYAKNAGILEPKDMHH